MGWFFGGGKPKTPKEEIDSIKTDHLPDNLKPTKPEFSALGDLNTQLSAQQSLNDGKSKNAPTAEKAKYNNEYAVQASALERSAKFAAQLDKSKNAAEAIAMSKLEEDTKQKNIEKDISKYKHQIKLAENEALRIKGQEERETMKYQAQINKETSDYNHKLSVQRDQAKMEVEKQKQAEMLQEQERSIQKQEQMRRETLEYESKLRGENDLAKAEAEARAKAIIDRENHDIKMKEIRLEAEERNKGLKQKYELFYENAEKLIKTNFGSFDAVTNTAKTVGMLGLVWFSVKEGTKLAGRFGRKYIEQPVLIRETSRKSLMRFAQQPIQSVAQVAKSVQASMGKGTALTESTLLNRVFLDPKVRDQIVDIGIGADQTIKNQGNLRNVLLWGPPGTGKTLFARELAKHSNMDYAVVSGGDFGPLGKAAVTEIHNLWDWAERREAGLKKQKGVILFIDEADAFLQKRTNKHGTMSEDMRSALNAFLMKSGTESKNIMIVLASNRPEQLDEAMTSRCDTQVYFGLPKKEERLQMLTYFYNENILESACNVNGNKSSFFGNIFSMFSSSRKLMPDDDLVENQSNILASVAERTEGLSGRQINKMVTSWEQSLYQSADGKLTRKMIDDGVESMLRTMRQAETWEKED